MSAGQRLADRPAAGSCRATGTAPGRRPPATSYMLCDVHSTPPCRRREARGCGRGCPCAVAGSSDAVGSSSSSRCGALSIALASATRVCSPDESTPHFVSRKRVRSNSLEQRLDARRQPAHAVDQAEHAQVLRDGEVPRQGRVDRGKVGALPAPGGGATPGRALRCAIDPAVGSQHAQDHVDGRRLAGAVGAEQADDLARRDLERHVVHRRSGTVGLAQVRNREHGHVRGPGPQYSSAVPPFEGRPFCGGALVVPWATFSRSSSRSLPGGCGSNSSGVGGRGLRGYRGAVAARCVWCGCGRGASGRGAAERAIAQARDARASQSRGRPRSSVHQPCSQAEQKQTTVPTCRHVTTTVSRLRQ